METGPKDFFISAKFGSNGILRISSILAREFPGEGVIHGRGRTPGKQEFPIVMNVTHRTLDGLKIWLKSLTEKVDCRSFRIQVQNRNPLLLDIEPSSEPMMPEGEDEPPLSRPDDGLYIGRRLEDHFNELVATNSPFTMRLSDLLTHVFICGVTGVGKTVIGKVLLEEAALNGIPVIAIDLKGDISSLGLMMSGEDPEEFLPWVSPDDDSSAEECAAVAASRHKQNLNKWGLTPQHIQHARKRIGVNVFTPRSNDGFRLALSAFPELLEGLEQLRQSDSDAYDSLIQFLADQFVARLALSRKQAEKAKGYVFEIVRTSFSRSLQMHGYDGVKRVLEEFRSPGLGIDLIGGLGTDEYISIKDREALANAVNALLTGAARHIYEGWPLNIADLVNPENAGGKTSVSIINVSHLEFKDQAYVVGYVAYLIWFWMQRLSETQKPRLLFYIDEIGGGGGRTAFFPSVAVSPCKPALNLLLRQGRAYGVCSVFATQNPGDIDYKGLSNCSTWMVGRLRTARDISKIEQGAADAELEFTSARRYMPGLADGQFVVKTPASPWAIIQERWLMGIHRRLPSQELRQLKRQYESEAKLLLDKAEEAHRGDGRANCISLLREAIRDYPFSVLVARAFLLLARVLIEDGKIADARTELDQLLRRWIAEEELAEAKFLLGSCYERESDFEKASLAFAEAQEVSKNPELKEHGRIHAEYCTARRTWPKLGLSKKIIWWTTGRKPEEGELIVLEVKDNEILTRVLNSVLAEVDFTLPVLVEYRKLLAASAAAEAAAVTRDGESVKATQWAQSQAFKMGETLVAKDLSGAAKIAERIVQRLTDAGVPASAAVLAEFKTLEEALGEQRNRLQSKVTHVEARQFEFEIARLLRLMGYDVHVTQMTGDDGVDVFARKEGEKVVVQCKKWTRPVGRSVVDELAGTASRYEADRAILATTSSFSPDAQNAATKHRIEMWDFAVLCRYFHEFGHLLICQNEKRQVLRQ